MPGTMVSPFPQEVFGANMRSDMGPQHEHQQQMHQQQQHDFASLAATTTQPDASQQRPGPERPSTPPNPTKPDAASDPPGGRIIITPNRQHEWNHQTLCKALSGLQQPDDLLRQPSRVEKASAPPMSARPQGSASVTSPPQQPTQPSTVISPVRFRELPQQRQLHILMQSQQQPRPQMHLQQPHQSQSAAPVQQPPGTGAAAVGTADRSRPQIMPSCGHLAQPVHESRTAIPEPLQHHQSQLPQHPQRMPQYQPPTGPPITRQKNIYQTQAAAFAGQRQQHSPLSTRPQPPLQQQQQNPLRVVPNYTAYRSKQHPHGQSHHPPSAPRATPTKSTRERLVTVGFSASFEHPTIVEAIQQSKSFPGFDVRLSGYVMGGGEVPDRCGHRDEGLVMHAANSSSSSIVGTGDANVPAASSNGSATSITELQNRSSSAPTRLLPKRTFPMASWTSTSPGSPAAADVPTRPRARTAWTMAGAEGRQRPSSIAIDDEAHKSRNLSEPHGVGFEPR